MKVKVNEASGPVLDWMVAKCKGYETFIDRLGLQTMFTDKGWKPSTNWSQGGPIIEREKMTVGKQIHKNDWSAESFDGEGINTAHIGFGPTPLIAAMRCFVVSKLGEEVEVPDEFATAS